MLNIIVCIKQVPNTDKVKIDTKTGTLIRNIIESIMNPDDLHALEMALSLKERYGGKVTAITMGPMHAAEILEEAYALGVDDAVLISDDAFMGSDSYITGKILSMAIKKLPDFDILITGVEAIDGNTSSVGYQLSEFLDVPFVTKLHKIDINNNQAIIERLYGHEYQRVKVSLPILIASNKGTNTVRYPALADIKTCFDKKITRMTLENIGGNENQFGLKGSPTIVLKSEALSHKRKHESITGSLNEKVDGLIYRLVKHNIMKY